MDKVTLRKEIRRLIDALKADGKPLSFVGISPVFEELVDTSYILTIYADWLKEVGKYDAITLVIEKMYSVLSEDVLRYINRVELCNQDGDVHFATNDVILNEAGIEVG